MTPPVEKHFTEGDVVRDLLRGWLTDCSPPSQSRQAYPAPFADAAHFAGMRTSVAEVALFAERILMV
jgi:hypothetical protein